MKKLDFYIIKKFLGTFFFSIVLIISISIVFDFSENLDEFIEKEVPISDIVFDYYLNFVPYFANLFSPLFIFISVIFFTSKMASDTEIIAILASGVSFKRLLVPYLISASIIAVLSIFLNSFIIPHSNAKRLEFTYKYIHTKNKNKNENVHLQLANNSYAYVGSYSIPNNIGIKFTLEQFSESGELTYKLIADFIRWDTTKNLWTIQNYYERTIDGYHETIKKGISKDTTINMHIEEFTRRDRDVEMLDYFQLEKQIEAEKFKGSKKVVLFEIEKYRRTAFPFASIVLTLIGAAIASRKVRGGIGMHLGFGLALSFGYILFMKVCQTFSTNGGLHPIIAMWIPNVIFGILAIYLLKKAPK